MGLTGRIASGSTYGGGASIGQGQGTTPLGSLVRPSIPRELHIANFTFRIGRFRGTA
ncbi:MAG: hypothetical protein AVDCRST_MAG64-939 [uncultured Phycisphaerae bacterium]|uniref:Uncharacterized protein n=1 Tax=uncultured Phycisphaerae bacterium TaxID=904963 RepID=A0A6J4NII0_9BACT|nr:MAG: hypothetical protein AVDCRST_MAG64-939 [uncultured Phycisphaerae bacterium]